MTYIPNLLLSLFAAASPAPASQLSISFCDAGEHYQFETVECAIELRNTGDKAIRISKGEARYPWDRIDSGTIVVPPKGTSYINARIDLRNEEGSIRRAFRFATDEPNQPFRGSEVHAYVQSVLDQADPTVDFGVIRTGEKATPSDSVQLSSRAVKDFRVKAIEAKPAWLDVSLSEDGRTVHARVIGDAPWGAVHLVDGIKLRVDTPLQTQVWLGVKALVLGDVVADGNPFQLGVIRTEGRHDFLIRLSSRSRKAFEVGDLEVERIKASAKVENCTPSTKDCKLIRLTISKDQPTGKLDGVLNVKLPGYGKVLPVELVGMLLSPTTKIHEMDELLKNSAEKSGGMSAMAGPLDLGKAIEHTIRKEDPAPPGTGPLLRWSVAHQGPIYGYAIYRADREDGEFLRINAEIIPVLAEDTDKSGSYQWRDNSAESGRTYWYRIGVLNRNGSKQDLTGAQKVVAK